MAKVRHFFKDPVRIAIIVAVTAALAFLLLYRLGSLAKGASLAEVHAAISPVGWHGIYHDALYLPIKLVRSVDFFIFRQHGQALTRLPSVFFGLLALGSFTWLVKLWYGNRVAVMSGILFACSAWFLHVSRIATFDVLYLWALPSLLLGNTLLQRYSKRVSVYYANVILWGLLLYIPGIIWILVINGFLQRSAIAKGWRNLGRWWQRALLILLGLVWLPLLIANLVQAHVWKSWIGLPAHLASPFMLIKHFIGVFVHLFIRGPEYPQIWLGRAPVLDIFTLALCVIGIFFYARHIEVARARTLFIFSLVSAVLIALEGPVGFSLLVPLAYIFAATGLAYLLREWLHVFPVNPLARNLGIGLICVAIALSCVYNLRAYFIAWPNAAMTKTVFRYHI
ncbi:MAG TPA: hypothetical protein VHB72_04180 [Candidatus Saccharimonadales bacterium]|nr:hypothetical protein [Candidatus Saccharimonadales bacterium]